MTAVALLALHGMGTQTKGYAEELKIRLQRRMGERFQDVGFVEILYQDILEPGEERIWNRSRNGLRWADLRRFVLSSLGDAAGFEDRKELLDSVYARIQIKIAQALLAAGRAFGDDVPVVFLARSLGAHALSCYLWDAQHYVPGDANPVRFGLWGNFSRLEHLLAEPGQTLTPAEVEFLRGICIRRLITTGCNIPIFVATQRPGDILPISRPTTDFTWHNYFDPDDILGWPMATLSDDYRQLVVDHRVAIHGDGLCDRLCRSWNPMVHDLYWRDAAIIDPLAATLRDLM